MVTRTEGSVSWGDDQDVESNDDYDERDGKDEERNYEDDERVHDERRKKLLNFRVNPKDQD